MNTTSNARLAFLISLLLLASDTFSQNPFKIHGFVIDQNTNDSLGQVLIKVDNSLKQTLTNDRGQYQMNLNTGKHQFQIIRKGYDTLFKDLDISSDAFHNFYLSRQGALIGEVRITAGRNENLVGSNSQILTKKDLERIPSFMGQRDPLKALQTLPGSGNAGEGNSGLYIRGGTAGQNLTILNGATIYNPSHLLGFFSVFNADAVDNIRLYKSGIPAQFGGRLSSLIEVSSEKRIRDSASFKGDVSVLASNASITIPINSSWSASLSARKTYMGLTVWPVLNKINLASKLFRQLDYDFSDLNLTSNAKLNARNYLHFSAFTSGDAFEFGLRSASISNSMRWKNKAFSLGWNSYLHDNISVNSTASFSGYDFDLTMSQEKYEAGISSRIKDYNLKTTVLFDLEKHQIQAGIQVIDHQFKPNTPYSKLGESELDFGLANNYHADNISLFASDDFDITDKLDLHLGGRLTHYRHKGPYTTTSEGGEETSFARNQTVAAFTYLEPSLIIRHKFSATSFLKASFSRNVQPLHLISVTAVNFPTDFWLPSLKNLPPETGFLASLGYFKNLKDDRYESYIDIYYKSMRGLTEYSGGIMNLLDNLKIENRLLFGTGNAYGAEFFLKKKSGKLTGWLSYTLAKSDRRFPSLNNNTRFPAKYDRRHDVSLVSNFSLNSKWNISGYFTYATGNTYTKPVSRYIIAGNIINEYGDFNGNRMPPYHRLDLSATYTFRNKMRYKSALSLSIYNVYNWQNPIFLYFVAKGDLDKNVISVKPESIAILPVLPSLIYRFSF